MEISISILSWNNIKTIQECIEVCESDMITYDITHEIIVVDNGSTDGTQDFATIKNKKNYGISKGKNQCIEACKGRFVFLLDADVIPVSNSIFKLYDHMTDNPKVEALGFYAQKWTNQRNKNGQQYYETYCNSLYEVKEIERACIYYGMFRKEVFDEGLRFDTRGAFGKAGYGWEDHDFFKEMNKRGIKQYAAHINSPQGRYYHAINSSIRAMGREKYTELCPAREKYFKDKWGAVWKYKIC